LNSEKIEKLWKKDKFNIEMFGKHGWKVSWIDKRTGKYGRKASWIVIRYGQYGRYASWILKIYGKYEEIQVE
jgi:hypothetical protein